MRISYEQELIQEGKCPSLVWVHTEDGIVDGRCMLPITDTEVGACEGHAEEIRSWHSMSEIEKLEWERAHDSAL